MSKILKRALKIAVLPAALMVVGKFITVFLIVAMQKLPFTITNSSVGLFSVQVILEDAKTTLMVNSYSNLVTFLVIALPTFYMLVKRTLVNNVASNPRTVVKLTKLNILKWITNDKTALLSITIWTMFLWIAAGITIASSMQFYTYTWIATLAGVSALFSAWGIIRTFEEETAKIYPREENGYL